MLGSRDRGATVSTLGLLFSCLLRGQVLSGLAWLLAVGVSQEPLGVSCEVSCTVTSPNSLCFVCLSVPAEELLEFGLKRIEKFEHVGTTEKLYPSVEAAAASLKMPLASTAYGAGEVSWVLGRHSSSICCVVCCQVCAAACRAAVYRGVHMCVLGPAAVSACRGYPAPATRAALHFHRITVAVGPLQHPAPAAVCQAASANTEHSRSLTWQDAMKAGDTPVPPSEDEVYAGGALCAEP